MNGAYQMDGAGGRNGDDRLEHDLRAWLRGFDPGELPMVARVRLDADLRAAATERSPRPRWLGAVQPVVAAVVLVLVALAAATVIGGSHSAASIIGAPTITDPISVVTPGDETGIPGPDYSAGLVLVALSALAGGLILVPKVRATFVRVAFPASAESRDDVLPIPRSWRSVSPLVWILGALAIVVAVAWFADQIGVINSGPVADPPNRIAVMIRIALQVPVLVLGSVAVPLRYRLTSPWTRLLMAGMSMSLVIQSLSLLATVVNLQSTYLWLIFLSLSSLQLFAIAGGLAARSGVVSKPPLALAASAIGLVFAASFASMLYEHAPYGLDRIDGLAEQALTWLLSVVWLITFWIGWANRDGDRSGRSWRLVAIAGAFAVASSIPQLVEPVMFWIGPPVLPDWPRYALQWSREYAALGGSVALIAALLLGIGPSPSREDPREP